MPGRADRPLWQSVPQPENLFVMANPTDAPTKDIEKARHTYERFMGTLKWAIPVIVVIVFIVVMLISS